MNKYDSIKTLLDKLFLSTLPVASSRMGCGVYHCLEYDENSQVSCFDFYAR